MASRTIGRLAREAGVSVETIRFYERVGLLRRPDTPRSGWREYGDDALTTVRYVKLAQELGLSLADIARLVSGLTGEPMAFCKSVRAAVRARLASMDDELRALAERRDVLVSFLERCAARGESGDCPTFRALTGGTTPPAPSVP